MKASVWIATSLDGFIARPDGGLDWLPAPSADEDYGYGEFIATVDVIVMGRRTFEMVIGFDEWAYSGTPVVVMSSGEVEIPESLDGQVQAADLEPAALLAALEAQGFEHAWIDGGQTVRSFLAAGLVSELVLTRVPVLLGDGVPLFGDLGGDVALHHDGTRTFDTGLVQSTYRVERISPHAPVDDATRTLEVSEGVETGEPHDSWYVRPVFSVSDTEAALTWYRDLLGFEEGWRYEEEGRLLVTQVSKGDFEMILSATSDGIGEARIFVELEDDQMAQFRTRLRELDIAHEFGHWGYPVILLHDPDGNELMFPFEDDT